jgi:dethiobiotin synthetase
VGKTVVSAALVRRYRNLPIKYWKPIQTGIEHDDDTAEVQRLSGCGPHGILDAGVRLPRPVSPHLAAKLNGSVVDVEGLLSIAKAQPAGGGWIVEGAGGVLVPLNEQALLVDFIRQLELPVLVVSPSRLGTINHTLLTIEALERRAIRIAGVVMVGPPDNESRDNRRAIERYGCVVVVGEMPTLEPLAPETLQRWADTSLDADERLRAFLV